MKPISTERLNEMLSQMPETFKTKKEAESRAEYLRIGTFKNATVVKSDRGYKVLKKK